MDEDRLSELPDSLILFILSLLDTREVVRTTILSKRWKNRWTAVPCLRFREESSNFVSGALSQWKGAKILEFTIFFSDDDPMIPSTDIDSWLHFATEKQVEKLTFDFGDNGGAYLVPQCLYSCSSLTKLTLCCFSLKIERNVQWNQLKSLVFENLDGLSGDAMNQILVGAPLLEMLALRYLEISENFNIRSTRLTVLEISSCNLEAELRIWGPNLLSLEISGLVCGSCLLYVPSLTTATLSFKDVCGEFEEIDRDDMAPLEMFHQVFRSIRHVQNVSLSDWSIQFLVDMKENAWLVEFPNAEFVELEFYSYRVTDILAVLGMFPKLKKLIVSQDHYMDESVASEMASLSPSLRHLETVNINICDRDFSISPLVEYVLENADVLEEIVLVFFRGRDDQDAYILDLKKLLEMRRSSPCAKVIVDEIITK